MEELFFDSQQGKELIKKAKVGDQEAFKILVENNKKLFYRLINSFSNLSRNSPILYSTDDMYSEVLTCFWIAINNYEFDKEVKFSNYFYSICLNRFRYIYKKKEGLYNYIDEEYDLDLISLLRSERSGKNELNDKINEIFLKSFLEECKKILKPNEYLVFAMYILENKSFQEIADYLKVSRQAIHAKYLKIINKIKNSKILKKFKRQDFITV